MHRQLKLDAAHAASTSGTPPSAGAYCPLDLYSGDEPRMRSAIAELWRGWCDDIEGKGNSLRLFVNGEVVRSDDVRPRGCLRLGTPLLTASNSPTLLTGAVLEAATRARRRR